jgi:hypothetical protein
MRLTKKEQAHVARLMFFCGWTKTKATAEVVRQKRMK